MIRRLLPGATIGICSPAGPVKPERMEAAAIRLRERGFEVVLSPNALSKDGFLSATDEIRAVELQNMFADPAIDAVFVSRGGTGSSRLLEWLNWEKIAEAQKPFLGFSDLTALQFALWNRNRFVTFSGPLAVEFDGALSHNTTSFAIEMLAGDAPDNWLDRFAESKIQILRGGASEIIAPLLPGNLTMITTLLGTPYMPDPRGVILVVEDVGEAPYRVERLLFHLRNAGMLRNLAALVVGDFGWDESDSDAREQLTRSLLDSTRGTRYPIIAGFPYGHGATRMTLPVGAPVRFSLETSNLSLGYAASVYDDVL
ncbi:LD-carboxypeptidase [bacterium]|nr:LD-carboxypeptidase [bacterium]